MLLRIIVKALVLLLALPALHLISFTGGILIAILAVIGVGLADIGTALALLPVVAIIGIPAATIGRLIGGKLGAKLVGYAIETGVMAIALGFIALIIPSLALVGFWATIASAAVLVAVNRVFKHVNQK